MFLIFINDIDIACEVSGAFIKKFGLVLPDCLNTGRQGKVPSNA